MHFGDWKGISMAGVEQRFLIFFTSLDTTVSGPACASETPISWYMYHEFVEVLWVLAHQLGSSSVAFKRELGMKGSRQGPDQRGLGGGWEVGKEELEQATHLRLAKVTETSLRVFDYTKDSGELQKERMFQMFKLVLEKAEEPEIELPISAGSSKKQESSRKTSISALLTTPKPLTVWITINCGNSERDGSTRPPDLPLEKPVCRSGSKS